MGASEILIELVRKHDRMEHFRRTNSADYPPSTLVIVFIPRTKEGEYAVYHAWDIPRIDIYRYGCTDADFDRPAAELAASSPCPLQELVSLAHELGHHESSLRGLPCVFDEARRVDTYKSEICAWMLGRAILTKHSFTDWDTFEEREQASLRGYREGLHLSDDEANDIQARVRIEVLVRAAQQAVATDLVAAKTST